MVPTQSSQYSIGAPLSVIGHAKRRAFSKKFPATSTLDLHLDFGLRQRKYPATLVSIFHHNPTLHKCLLVRDLGEVPSRRLQRTVALSCDNRSARGSKKTSHSSNNELPSWYASRQCAHDN